MSILTKEERDEWRYDSSRDEDTDDGNGHPREWDGEDVIRALATIDALEAKHDSRRNKMIRQERDISRLNNELNIRMANAEKDTTIIEAMEADYKEMRSEHDAAVEQSEEYREVSDEIRALATDELNTRVVGGHRQALERVIELLGGEE